MQLSLCLIIVLSVILKHDILPPPFISCAYYLCRSVMLNCFESNPKPIPGNTDTALGGSATSTNGSCTTEQEWWRHHVIYQIYPRSFKDSNGDGAGDLKGIESKLDYIVELGVKTIWLSPIYKSPMKDFGYDIEDFKDVDERFGTLQDFRDLVKAMRMRDLRLVMDLVPNHSSDQHEWFQKSLRKEDPYTDYYVWVPPKGFEDGKPIPPNNWLSVFGGSAWEWYEGRGEFYLHQFAKEQPDLNFRNPAVKEEMLDVMRFWLEQGVDGFRVDAMPHLFEDGELRDEPAINETKVQQGDYNGLHHVHTHNLPEVLEVMADFRNTLDEYSEMTDKVRKLMMAEVYDSVEKTMQYYGDRHRPLADFPFNFYLMTNISRESSPYDIKNTIELWMSNMPETKWANWVLGNHDHGRVASRFGGDLVDCLNMILLMLPGTAVTYYGEELGMEDTPVSWELTVDPAGLNVGPEKYKDHSRDPERTPMQWNAFKNAGFSDADKTWLPLHPDFQTVNVETQSQGTSHLNVYKALVRARGDVSVMYGALNMRVLNDAVFAFSRSYSGNRSYVVAVNWSNTSVTVDLRTFDDVPDIAEVFVTSVNYSGAPTKTLSINSVSLDAREGIVLSYMPEIKD
ncbi:maltase 2-like isoform X2 [Periplaneta americana]|uniref:maltase 2-like isoform X2 n=2 Tax=Periplaneta americana TaxID=6978 RepID=UPI0037E90A36